MSGMVFPGGAVAVVGAVSRSVIHRAGMIRCVATVLRYCCMFSGVDPLSVYTPSSTGTSGPTGTPKLPSPKFRNLLPDTFTVSTNECE